MFADAILENVYVRRPVTISSSLKQNRILYIMLHYQIKQKPACMYIPSYRRTDGQIDRQENRQTDRQRNKRTDGLNK